MKCFLISVFSITLTHFFSMHPFPTPLRFSDIFRGQRKGAGGTNGLNTGIAGQQEKRNSDYNSSLPLPPASRTLRHQSDNQCRKLTPAHTYWLDQWKKIQKIENLLQLIISLFSCEVRSSLRITLIEKEATISDDLKNKFQILLLIKLMRQIASIVSK